MEIEKDIPLPRSFSGEKGRPAKYPWKHMSAGDSFLIAQQDIPPSGHSGVSAMAANNLGAGNFRTRSEAGGIRVWKVA